MAARVLVGVVAHDRGVRDRLVDAAVDPREAGGDLVDGAVEVVDPPLERDGELDEILAAAADERSLGVTKAPNACPGDRCDDQAGRAEQHPENGN